eukprot:CAMPEP_0113845270 /NCGR_PEP_ID=MMETSP0372-20130328/663_1 /TAXON_ID=340204 /ORGANISM="Lankesteria abbotti" /LENGTH=140 /DNA_ID=CAMNT_0000814293 /DNA_START=72 /DNA_END=491 /DNA_ORIENTATION=- /assembly_acc=CAM_ASM_000359
MTKTKKMARRKLAPSGAASSGGIDDVGLMRNVMPHLQLSVDVALSVLIVNVVPYTEIDWQAYMKQVGSFLGGELNYYNLKGDTGPIVYPAGHVYLFSLLYNITDSGTMIHTVQRVFLCCYLTYLVILLRMFLKSGERSFW